MDGFSYIFVKNFSKKVLQFDFLCATLKAYLRRNLKIMIKNLPVLNNGFVSTKSGRPLFCIGNFSLVMS